MSEGLLALAALGLGAPSALAGWLGWRLAATRRRARAAEDLLRQSVEAMPAAALIYDARERLVACNAEAEAQHARLGAALGPGSRLEDVLWAMARSGRVPAAAGREAEWVAERLASFRAADANGEERFVDGRWFKVYFRPLEDGGRLVLRLDVTQSREREAALAESERRFRDLAEVSSDWFWRTDVEHRFLPPKEDNARGIGPGVPGRTRWEVADPEDLIAEPEKWARHYADLEARREFRNLRYWAVDPSGRRIYVRTSGRPAFDEAGNFLGYRGASSDLTPQVEAERDAADAQSRLVEALENLPLGIAVFDASERLIICNSNLARFLPAAAHLLVPGATREEIVRASVAGGDLSEWSGREAEFLERWRNRPRDSGAVREYRLADGRAMSVVERRTSDGGHVVAYSDVTELKRRHGELAEKSALLRATLDNIEQGLAVFGPDLRLLAWNARYFTLAGIPEELGRVGATAREISDAVLAVTVESEGDAERRYAGFVRLDPASMEVRLKNGRTLQVNRSRMPDGGVVVTIADITELKGREAELAAKTTEMQTVFENLAEGVSVVDKDLNVVAFNRTGLRLLNFPETPFARFEDYIRYNAERGEYGPGDVEAQVAERVALAKQFVPHAFERERPDGTIVEVRGNPVPGGGFVTTYRDVTEQRRVEETLRKAKEQAELANRAKSEFLANTSHELRTPLNAILGFSEIILQQMFGPIGQERYLEYAQDIHNSGSHLLSIINDLLDLAKVEAGRFDMQEEAIALPEVVEGAVRFVRDRADAAGLELAVSVAAEAPQLYGDARALKQVIVNLLSNAVKFTTEGGRVAVRAGLAEDGWLDVAVDDTGIGMSERDIEVALTPFGQVEGALNRRYEGTGLGLPLGRRFVGVHGGALRIDSAPGSGTTVTARFPPERLLWPEPARSVG